MGLFSSKKNGLIAIDISATGVKLLELSRVRSGYEVQSMAIVPLPRDAIVENTVIDSMAVSQALLDVVEKAKPKSRRAVISVSGNAVIIKVIQVPMVTEFDLESQIDFEADKHVPYDIEEVYLDFQIMGPSKEDPEMMDVVLVACKREIVDDYQLVLSEAGLETKCVDCAVFALENAAEIMGLLDDDKVVESFEEDEGQAIALVNIGAHLVNVNIIKNGQMAFVRDQFYGGENLTEEIQKEHSLGYQAAEDLKKTSFTDVNPEAVEHFYVGLASELVRSLDFYAANHGESPVRQIYLMGGGALIPDIATEIEQRLGISTEVVNPFDSIKVNKKKFDIDELHRMGTMMMAPVGLAVRSFDE
ncbi:MAG: type IV pilus assembly protein PilM [Mariprofundaceae bacterium]|nr:type IV pilus assembly protein PilM [Mariprofundaceae bacterium]